jgi:hypothetical protein
LAKANWHFYLIHALKGAAMDICLNQFLSKVGVLTAPCSIGEDTQPRTNKFWLKPNCIFIIPRPKGRGNGYFQIIIFKIK